MTRGRPVREKDGPVALAAAILTGSADLRGAACTANARLFDPDVPAQTLGYDTDHARERAVEATCQRCPARGPCWQWASGLSTQRIVGPTAATVAVAGTLRPRGGRPARTQASTPASPASKDPDPEPARPRPPRRPGARRRGRPSVHRRGTPRRSPR